MYHGERLNAWTHLIGAVAACTGAVWLTVQAPTTACAGERRW